MSREWAALLDYWIEKYAVDEDEVPEADGDRRHFRSIVCRPRVDRLMELVDLSPDQRTETHASPVAPWLAFFASVRPMGASAVTQSLADILKYLKTEVHGFNINQKFTNEEILQFGLCKELDADAEEYPLSMAVFYKDCKRRNATNLIEALLEAGANPDLERGNGAGSIRKMLESRNLHLYLE